MQKSFEQNQFELGLIFSLVEIDLPGCWWHRIISIYFAYISKLTEFFTRTQNGGLINFTSPQIQA